MDGERRGTGGRIALVSVGVPVVVGLGLLVLIWAATTGPADIFGSSGRRRFRLPPYTPSPTASPTSSGEPSAGGSFRDLPKGNGHDLHWLGSLIGWSMVLLVVIAVALAARWAWTNRWRPPAKPESADFDVLPAVQAVSDALSRDAAEQLAAVAEGSPRNGIVECWLRLEETIAAAGLPRERWETATEFTVRVLRALDIDPRAIGTLARLYREARFSEHELGEDARTAARSALQQLHSDLLELGVPLPPGAAR